MPDAFQVEKRLRAVRDPLVRPVENEAGEFDMLRIRADEELPAADIDDAACARHADEPHSRGQRELRDDISAGGKENLRILSRSLVQHLPEGTTLVFAAAGPHAEIRCADRSAQRCVFDAGKAGRQGAADRQACHREAGRGGQERASVQLRRNVHHLLPAQQDHAVARPGGEPARGCAASAGSLPSFDEQSLYTRGGQ